MYGDSQALSPHSSPIMIFPPNSSPNEESAPMESHSNSSTNYSVHGEAGFSSRFVCGDGQLPPQYPARQSGSYRGVVFGSPGLVRQGSSPPGFFSQITSHNGYGVGSYRISDGGTNGDLTPSSIRLKNHIISYPPSSLGLSPRFTEFKNEDGSKVGNNVITSGENSFFSSGFPFNSWNYSSENFSTIKHEPDNDHKLFATSQLRNRGRGTLSHHLSLPKTSSEMVAMEKLLQLQDTVPCKIRAKRGCATHPRSIAERVRRTRISERMRKLQELVPNMDKQTNTADMLDLAVNYIKSLQKEYKALSDDRANCKCLASQL